MGFDIVCIVFHHIHWPEKKKTYGTSSDTSIDEGSHITESYQPSLFNLQMENEVSSEGLTLD